MKRFFVCTALTLFIGFTAQAQQNAARIFYSRNVPTVIRQQVPKGGETKFFGMWKSENTKIDLLIHFYSAPTKEEPLLCKVDIFERSRSNRRMKPINSVRLTDNPSLFKYATNNVPNTVVTLTYGADVIWANQKEKRLPLLRFQVLSSGGLHGDYGTYVLIDFPHGWDKNTNVEYYNWGGTIDTSDSVNFDKVDKKGYMVITTTYTEYNDVQNNVYKEEFYWDGEKFSKRGPEAG